MLYILYIEICVFTEFKKNTIAQTYTDKILYCFLGQSIKGKNSKIFDIVIHNALFKIT